MSWFENKILKYDYDLKDTKKLCWSDSKNCRHIRTAFGNVCLKSTSVYRCQVLYKDIKYENKHTKELMYNNLYILGNFRSYMFSIFSNI